MCEWFLSHGADPNAECTYGWTPLQSAITRAPRDIINLLFQHGGSIGRGQLIHAAVHRTKPDWPEVFEMLLDKGCDINTIRYHNHKVAYDHYNFLMGLGTPLHEAAEFGRLDVVKFLLDHGADPHARDTHGWLPIDQAHNNRHGEVVELLKPFWDPKEMTGRARSQ